MMFSIRSFVLYAVGTSMCGGLLVLLCLPLCALLRRLRAPSKLLCLLWLAVGLRFLLPGGIPVSIRQPGSAAPIQQAGAVVQALTVPAELPAQALPGAAGSAPLPGSMFNIWVVLAAIWAAGVVVLLVRAAAGYCRLRRMVTLACKTPDGCYTCAAVATPFTLGVLRPRIYMPQSLQGSPRRAVLLHERTHIRRGDPITKPLYYLAACLHWWNPLAWLAFRQFEQYMELACDEAAIGTAPAAERADYCESILRFATVRQMPGALAFGQGQVAKRVAHLLKYRKPAPLLLALGCVLVALGCGACALRPQAEAITPQAEPVSAASEPTPEPATSADDTLTNSAAEPTAQPEQPQATAEPLVFGWPVADFHYIARFVSDYHRGADYSATKGTPVLAVYGGTVAVANYNHPSYGNHVVIDHGTLPDGHSYRTLYAHLDTLSVAAGDTVTQGQQLGTVGSTGASTGNHLHLELFVDGALTDTRTMIPYDNTTSPDLHLTTTLDFICPLESYTTISAPFRTDDSDTPPHLGVDFAVAGGTPVQAAQSGVVTQACWDDDHGYFVTIYHGANTAANDDGTYPANYATSYAHLQSKPAVQVGVGTPVAVFAGCTARNARPGWIARAETLLRRWGYVVLDGGGFTCCGGTLHHAGLFAAQAEVRRRNIERWRDMGRPVIAAFCASCKHGLDAYAEEGGMEPEEAALWKRQVRGLSALLAAPVCETVPDAPARIGYHQPCHWGEDDPAAWAVSSR